MIILAFGIPQPTTGDRGSVFFPALEEVIQRFAAHDHDGNNTELISAAFSQAGTVQAPIASWALVTTGIYTQTVIVPTDFTYDNSMIQVRRDDTKELVYPKVERISNTQIRLTAATNTLDYRVYLK